MVDCWATFFSSLLIWHLNLPATNPIHTDDMYWRPYPSRSRDHVHNGNNCHSDDCTWPCRFAWHDDPWQRTTIYVSDWFASPEWVHWGRFQRYPRASTKIHHCDNIERFYRCVPYSSQHNKRCILDLRYRFLFCAGGRACWEKRRERRKLFKFNHGYQKRNNKKNAKSICSYSEMFTKMEILFYLNNNVFLWPLIWYLL